MPDKPLILLGDSTRTIGSPCRPWDLVSERSGFTSAVHIGCSTVTTRAGTIYVLHAFEKKTRKTAARDLEIGRERFRALGKLRQEDGKEERG